jgi:hypothetical protein
MQTKKRKNPYISHNLDVADPRFLYFIKNMNYDLACWIQYVGFENDNGRLYFKFKSSQESLRFEIFAGICVNDVESDLSISFNEIYEHYRKLKYDNI